MNKRPGHVNVTIEAGYCSFCDRTRNLRREERHLGTLVRTIVTCETCHRTLSSTMGVAHAETPATEAVEAKTPAVEVKAEPAKTATPTKRTPSPKATARPKAATTRRTPKSK